MLRVMLVDDSQKEVSLLKEGLEAAGYDVIEVTISTTSAPALLDRVAAMRPDVIIIDTDSPTRDTLEQLSFVSAKQPRPIVLFTEDRDNATIQAAIKAGVSAYVVAGMHPDRLQPILDVAVARFEQERGLRDELKSAHERLAELRLVRAGIAADDCRGARVRRTGDGSMTAGFVEQTDRRMSMTQPLSPWWPSRTIITRLSRDRLMVRHPIQQRGYY